MSKSNFEKLLDRCRIVSDLESAGGLHGWDERCFMPDDGEEGRGHVVGTLRQLAHRELTSSSLRKLLAKAEIDLAGEPEDSDRAATLRVVRGDCERAGKLEPELVAEEARLQTASQAAWAQARKVSDFSIFQPHLTKLVDLQRRKADQYGFNEHPLDGLLPDYEPGMTSGELRQIFGALKPELVKLIRSLNGTCATDSEVLESGFAPAVQTAFGRKLMANIGLDMKRVRLDYSTHPFMQPIVSPFDVRMTFRRESRFSLLSVMHEGGHALYEQGINPAFARLPLGRITSLSAHESQSRTWENIVGRGKAFWVYWYPRLQRSFKSQLKDVSFETFYAEINNVKPGFIRVEADELHYNLHIILRFELELDLISGALPVSKLPREWMDRFEEMFGIRPPDDRQGVLQDIHWSGGSFGYFPTYSLGNLLGAQLFEKAEADIPGLASELANGNCLSLRQWQLEHVHQYGRKYGAKELARRITGRELSHDAFLRYATRKFVG